VAKSMPGTLASQMSLWCIC